MKYIVNIPPFIQVIDYAELFREQSMKPTQGVSFAKKR